MTWMKHFQGNISWAPDAGDGGLAFVGWSLGPFAVSENMNSDLLQSKNLNLYAPPGMGSSLPGVSQVC